MVLNIDKFINKLILIYPLIVLICEIINKNFGIDLLMKFTFIIFLLILLKFKDIKMKFLIFIILSINTLQFIMGYKFFDYNILIRFLIFLTFLGFFSNKKNICIFKHYIDLNKNILINIFKACSIIIFIYLFLNQGYVNKWGGNNYFIGPFSSPHKMGYYLLGLQAMDIFIDKNFRKKSNLFYQSIFVILQMLTGARIPLLVSAITVLLALKKYIKTRARFIIILIFLLIITLIIVFEKDIIKDIPFIQKFIYTEGKDSLSSGRDLIWKANLNVYKDSALYIKLLGNGMLYSFYANLLYLNNEIWSHNDFIQILLGNGLIGLIIYCVMLLNLCRIYKSEILLIVLFILAFFNGLFTYYFFGVMIIYYLMAIYNFKGEYYENIKNNIKKNRDL